MTIETSNFAVIRNGSVFKCKGSELDTTLNDTDRLFIQRGDQHFTVTQAQVGNIEDDDLTACTDEDGVTYKVTGAQLKAILVPDSTTQFIVRDQARNFDFVEGGDINTLPFGSIFTPTIIADDGSDVLANWDVTWEIDEYNPKPGTIRTCITQFLVGNSNFESNPIQDTNPIEWHLHSDVVNPTANQCLAERNQCYFLCDSDYCKSICDREYSKCIEGAQVGYKPSDRIDTIKITLVNKRKATDTRTLRYTFQQGQTTPWQDDNAIVTLHYRTVDGGQFDCMTRVNYDTQVINVYEIYPDGVVKKLDRDDPAISGSQYMTYMTRAGEFVLTLSTDLSDTLKFQDGGRFEFLEHTDVSAVTSWRQAFFNTARSGNQVDIKGLEYFDTSNVTDMYDMFRDTQKAKLSGINNWDVSKVTDFGNIFWGSGVQIDSYRINLSSWDTSKGGYMAGMFSRTAVNPRGIEGWNTSSATNMNFMFSMHKDTTFKPDLTGWCVTKITSKPFDFDEDKPDWFTQPQWGTCP